MPQLVNPLLTNKEDDDPILEFKNIDTGHLELKKINLNGIPFYPASGNELIAHTLHRLEELRETQQWLTTKVGAQLVLPFDPYRCIWVKMHKKFLNLAQNSFINIPDGAGLLWQARMERQKLPELVTTISYSMNLIRLAQAKGYTVFLVGSKDEVLEKLVSNLKRSFPQLRIVGKHHGYFKGASKQRVLDALRKTDPHIIFLGIGYHRGMKWLAENQTALGNCILVNMAAELDVLAGKRKKAPDFIVTRGYTWLWRCLNRPWRWPRLLLVFYWFFTTLLRRLFIRKKTQ